MSPIYSLMLVSPVWRDWSSVLFYVHRDSKTITVLGTGAQDGHLDFHTAPELCTESPTEHSYMGGGRERERDRERGRETETERKRERIRNTEREETDRQTERDRDKDRQTETDRDREVLNTRPERSDRFAK